MTKEKPGRSQKYPFAVAAQVSKDQRDFLDSECAKLGVKMSEYIRLIIQDLMDSRP